MFQQLFSQDMNEAIYHQVQFNGGQSMSKTEFHNVFKTLRVKSLMKDGQAIDLKNGLFLQMLLPIGMKVSNKKRMEQKH